MDELKVLAELDDREGDDPIDDQVRSCGPLLRIYDGSEWSDLDSLRVAFIHSEAKEVLLHDNRTRKLIGLSNDGNDETEVQLQHGVVGLRCFSYTVQELNVDDERLSWTQLEPSDDNIEDTAPELEHLFPECHGNQVGEKDQYITLLEYPVKYWLRQGYHATPDFVDTFDLKNEFWSLDSTVRRRWWKCYIRSDNDFVEGVDKLTAMHIAAFFGLTHLINSLLAHGHESEIHTRDSSNSQPLHWAAYGGHLEAMETLMQNKADINDGQQDQCWTPLHMAALNGKTDAMLLLMNGHYGIANVNAVAKGDGTALTVALSYNEEKAAKLLLNCGGDPNLTADNGESPIAIAAHSGLDERFLLLWEKGGRRNLTSQRFGSALASAASAGHESIFKKILRYSDQASRQEALEEAARNGFHKIVWFLLQTSQDLKCDNAFETAASLGHDLVLTELWNHTSLGRSALSQRTLNNALYKDTGSEKVTTVRLLPQNFGADPNATGARDGSGNALTVSACEGTVEILKMLIDSGGDVNASSGFPLQIAAYEDHSDVVKLLLRNKAFVDANSPLFHEGTAL